MRSRRSPLRLLFGAVCLWSIASSLSAGERTDTVAVRSWPEGATVIVDGRIEGVTPLLLELSRTAAHHVRVEHAGFDPQEAVIRSSLSWAVARHVLLDGFGLGLVGTAADLKNGDSHRLTPDCVDLVLRRSIDLNARLLPELLGVAGPALQSAP